MKKTFKRWGRQEIKETDEQTDRYAQTTALIVIILLKVLFYLSDFFSLLKISSVYFWPLKPLVIATKKEKTAANAARFIVGQQIQGSQF